MRLTEPATELRGVVGKVTIGAITMGVRTGMYVPQYVTAFCVAKSLKYYSTAAREHGSHWGAPKHRSMGAPEH